MHTKADVLALARAGAFVPLTAETLPAAIARQEKLNARFQSAMDNGFVGGNQAPGPAPVLMAKVDLAHGEHDLDLSAQASALVAALSSRRARRRRKKK